MAVPRTLEDARLWVARLTGLVTVVHECQDVLQELGVRLHLAGKLSDPLPATKWRVERAYMERQLSIALDNVWDATGKRTLKDAWELVTDVRVRVDDAVAAYEEYRRTLHARETMLKAGQLDGQDDRAQADSAVDQSLAEYDQAVSEACRLIPANTEMTDLT